MLEDKLKRLDRERLFESVVSQIESLIIDLQLASGVALPAERQLAERFGVSRTAIREAMKVLAQKGLVEVQQGRGILVARPGHRSLSDSLHLLMRLDGVGIGELVETRMALETTIVRLAALRSDPEGCASLRDCADHMACLTGDAERWVEFDISFHHTLALMARNQLLVWINSSIRELLRASILQGFNAEGAVMRAMRYHEEILEAVCRKDPEAAAAAMHKHLESVEHDFINLGVIVPDGRASESPMD
ncbi:MAG TPA: FadR/GntR family transcriptional regulator [Chloroflexota bacterium]|nr:FadR/GntR family transcriptional regulator [Chloroflexota bacterium]